jgi:4-amino-4-deoxy-L-arabinose transferase-like glycosyltransferase
MNEMKLLNSIKNKEGLIILAIFLASFLLRVTLVGTKIGQDEVYYVGYATDIIHNRPWSNVFPPLLELIFIPILALTNESAFAIHIFTALLGAIAITLTYFIGRKFMNRTAGIIGAVLLMFNTTHWFFSDFGMLDVPATLFALIGFYFYWAGYKQKREKYLLLGALFTSGAVLIRYTIFPAAALLGYLILFDRKNLKNKMLMAYILLPFIVWGIWMFYFITQNGWLWGWWKNYVTGQLSINVPIYSYFQNSYDEFLLPIVSWLVLFASVFLILKKKNVAQTKFNEYIFIILFLAVFAFMSQKFLTDQQRAAFGILSLAPLAILYFFKSEDFHKYAIIYIGTVFVFFSPLGVKFPRYLMPALPLLYLLVGQLVSDLKKFKVFFVVAIVVIAIFAFSNFTDTVKKLIVDKYINDVKYEAQTYVNNNSPECSKVFSKTWYGFYYLRTRITDLPSDTAGLQNMIKSSCSCPPEYFISEGGLDSKFANSGILTEEKTFTQTITVPKIDWNGVSYDQTVLVPIEIWRINNSTINSLCSQLV